MTEWMDAVKKAHQMLKKKNPSATLGDAMKEAKKTYSKKAEKKETKKYGRKTTPKKGEKKEKM